MKRTVVATLLALCGLVSSVPTAQAKTESAARFTGVYVMSSSLPPAFGTPNSVSWQFTTKGCTEAAAHAMKNKPAAAAGICTIRAVGVATGTCATASGTGQGVYTDSLGQTLSFSLVFTLADPTWTWTGKIAKGPQSGSFQATGTWQPTGAPCNPVGTIGTFDYTLP